MKSNISFLTLFLISIFSLNAQVTAEKFIDFIPIPPVQLKSDIVSTSSDNKIIKISTTEMSLDKKAVINFMPNESMQTTIQQLTDDGNVAYFYSGRSVKKGTYRLTVDYNKYIIQNTENYWKIPWQPLKN